MAEKTKTKVTFLKKGGFGLLGVWLETLAEAIKKVANFLKI